MPSDGSARMTAVNVRTGQAAWQAARLGEGPLAARHGEADRPRRRRHAGADQGHVAGFDVLSQVAPEKDCLDTDDAVRYEALRA